MAPFLDPGSLAFDDPEHYGYRRLATTLEEHRQRLLEPSWRYIMNYESLAMSQGDLIHSTYQAALGVNRVKAEVGAIPADQAPQTEARIAQATVAMERIDEIVAGDPAHRAAALADFKAEVDRLNESTVCEKTDLNWPAYTRPRHVLNVIALWFSENWALLTGRRRYGVHREPVAPAVVVPQEKGRP